MYAFLFYFKDKLINFRDFATFYEKGNVPTGKERAHKIGGGENDTTPRISSTLGISSNSFPRLSFLSPSLSPLTRRDIWCRPLPQSRVPSAISSALKPLQLQTPTVSSPLFHPVLLRPPFTRFHITPAFLPLFLSFSLFPCSFLSLTRLRHVAAHRSHLHLPATLVKVTL